MSMYRGNIFKKKPKFKLHKPDVVKSLSLPMVLVILVLIVLPMILLLCYSFIEKNAGDIAYKINFTNYITAFTTYYYWKSLLKSFEFALISTLICLLIGYPFAYFLSKVKNRYQGIIVLLINAPMWVNMTLRVFGLKALVGNDGVIQKMLLESLGVNIYNNGFALIVGLVYIYLPFMIIPIYTSLIKIEKSHIEAGSDLGGTPWQVFRKVTFPLSFSGVLSGITMVFLPSATAIVAPHYLYNFSNNGQFIGQIIEGKVNQGYYGAGSAISIVIAIIITIMSLSVNKFDRYATLSEGDN